MNQSVKNNLQWPFLIVRCWGPGKDSQRFLNCLFQAQDKYPGLVQEIWFCGNSLNGLDDVKKRIEANLPFKNECAKRNILFSYQQGITLNHDPDYIPRPHLFSDEAWTVGSNGQIFYGMFCPNSQEARDYNQKEAELIMNVLQPDSYWPDDDLRLTKFTPAEVCFCDKCIAKFNKMFNHEFTREKLAETLFGKNADFNIREEWTLCNAHSLGEFSAVFRKAADKVLPNCRLGMQTVHSFWTYDGPDFKPLLEGLSGPKCIPIGIRPGAGYYNDRVPRDMIKKALTVGLECSRCKKYGFVAQMCYEAENYPHVSAEKSPESEMTECALALAYGCDSLALYWGSDRNAESDENYAFYFDILNLYKPYLMSIRDAFRDSSITGGALYHGSRKLADTNWKSMEDPTEERLLENSIPVTRSTDEAEFLVLNTRTIGQLGKDDLEKVFSRPVLMDINSFTKLAEDFPNLSFIRKVKLTPVASNRTCTPSNRNLEIFGHYTAQDMNTCITRLSPDVVSFSSTAVDSNASGICMIPTEFGGKVVLIQNLDLWHLWTGYRRNAILDALDTAIGKGTAVRLLTVGYCVTVVARKALNGKTIGVFLLNTSAGRTPDLTIALRNPAHEKYLVQRPGMEPIFATVISRNEKEVILKVPPLTAWQSLLIEGVEKDD